MILVNYFVRAHRVGPCGAAAGAPYQVGFGAQTPDRLLVRVRGPTRNRGLPDGGSDAREECALQRMELMMATIGGQW